MLLLALICIYSGHIIYKMLSTYILRKHIKVGDVCKVYIGERKIAGIVLRISNDIDIWVADRVIRFSRNQIYV